ncbi:adenylate kinase [Pseudoclavibacter chungangensis]|uniref:Adenylate kinase n=1 Tax=Pseudoclavibacter chungangensis TaxID=587635 RepID=A0A7J5C286_9MICO|nr:adenylate kinase [Pseudoclavibacter chungangensis]KAB1662290.1 adenylate kinase [Pseudoclavibacter chungangensis]NYJ65497.1 adenylate kinase [Pseudoclavibacter chungangensis]
MTTRSTEDAVRLLIVGPPGAGKGTQATRVSEAYGVPAVSTGDIFRANIKNETELGLKVKAIIESGDLVPDTLTNELVADRLGHGDAKSGFLLDGYPRTVEQVEYLTALLKAQGTAIDAVIQLEVDTDEVVARLRQRAIEQGRSDDTEDAIRHRQDVYARETAPVLEIYEARGLVVKVDGLGSVDEVTSRIEAGLAEKGIPTR